jgi:hypothetical protein
LQQRVVVVILVAMADDRDEYTLVDDIVRQYAVYTV